MKKHFVEKHETVIQHYSFVPTTGKQVGDVVKKSTKVAEISFFRPKIDHSTGEVVFWDKVNLTKGFIIDLYNAIKELESQETDHTITKDDFLPF